MAKSRFKVEFIGTAIVELDSAVIDVVDDEWRSVFYGDLRTPRDIAEHIAYNLVCNRWSLSQLDGWADQPDGNARVIEEPDWDVSARPIKDSQ